MAHALPHRMIPAVLLASSATLGGIAIGEPAVACAEPNTFNPGQYDECVARMGVTSKRFCCSQAGGEWTKEEVKDGAGNVVQTVWLCKAKAASADAPGWVPPGGIPSTLPTNTLQPAQTPPPADTPPTLAPASPG